MANNRLIFEGLNELLSDLRKLPEELTGEGGHIVEAKANGAAVSIRSGYPRRSGSLRDGLGVTHTRSRFGAISVVKNTDPEAKVFEVGSQARHTKLGANRGSMPANHIFTQSVIRARRSMYSELAELLRRHGLQVSGEGTS